MKYYAGLDVSMKETFICVMNSNRKVCHENIVSTEPNAIANYLYTLDLDIDLIGLESGSLSHWLTSELQELKLPVKCIDARHLAGYLSLNINKTDKNDARGIADAMRSQMFKEVSVKPKGDIAIGTLLSSRKLLVNQRVQLTMAIRGMLKPFGIRLGVLPRTESAIDKIQLELGKIPEEASTGILYLLKSLKGLYSSIKELDKKIKVESDKRVPVKNLMSIPGVGPITALKFAAEIGDPKRFKKSKKVGAYTGLTPRQYSSGEIHRQGRISKCGSHELRTLLVEAGHVILTRTNSWSKLKAWGMKVQKKHGIKKAATAIGRKLSVIMHQMLLTGESFRFTDKVLTETKV